MDCQKEKYQFQLQREALRRAVVRHAERLSGVIHGSIIEAEHAELEKSMVKSLQFKLSTALTRADIQAEELQRAEMRVHELEMLRLTLEEDSQSMVARQVSDQVEELDQLLNEKEKEVYDLRAEQETLYEERQIIKDNLDALLTSLQQAVEACQADHFQGLDLFEQREEEYRNALLSTGGSATNRQENKMERLKLMINSLLSDILNSNKVLKQNLDVMKQLKGGVEQMVEQLVVSDRQYTQMGDEISHWRGNGNTELSDF
jgi:hypothetical protein